MKAIILENKRIGNSSLLKTQRDKYYKMRFSCDGLSGASPGQFVMIKVNNSNDPFLRRPMSIYRIPYHPPFKKGGRGEFEILYQVVGKGTNIMSELKKGDEIDVLGPLGRGFWIPEKIERAIIVAGGIGVAPMVALAEKIRGKGQGARGKISVFIGGKTKNDILCKEDFKKIRAKVYIATEDGSMGKKGTCVDLLSAFSFQPSAYIFACGPQGMLKAVADIARDKNMACQVSLDKRMACGTGACLGCVVKVSGQWSVVSGQKNKKDDASTLNTQHSTHYKCVCTDGPVFDAEEINWESI